MGGEQKQPRIGDICPKCETGTMCATYEAYECRCDHCGYWFDGWTGSEKTFNWEGEGQDEG